MVSPAGPVQWRPKLRAKSWQLLGTVPFAMAMSPAMPCLRVQGNQRWGTLPWR